MSEGTSPEALRALRDRHTRAVRWLGFLDDAALWGGMVLLLPYLLFGLSQFWFWGVFVVGDGLAVFLAVWLQKPARARVNALEQELAVLSLRAAGLEDHIDSMMKGSKVRE